MIVKDCYVELDYYFSDTDEYKNIKLPRNNFYPDLHDGVYKNVDIVYDIILTCSGLKILYVRCIKIGNQKYVNIN